MSPYPSTKVISRVLRDLGLRHRTTMVKGITQHADFWVFPIVNAAGERLNNNVGLYTRRYEQALWDAREQIERETETAGWAWIVRKVRRGDYVNLVVTTDLVVYGNVHQYDDLPLGKM